MNLASTWYGDITITNSNQIQIADEGYVQNYYGTFTYGYYGLTGGTVTSTDYYEFGRKYYDIKGGSYSALTVESFIDSGNISALFAYVFSGNDTFNGSAQTDVLNGFAGNDKILGKGGDDLLKGGAGNDTLNGGTGADTLFGGAGNDTYYVDNSRDKVYESSTSDGSTDSGGTDTVFSYLSSYTLGNFVENARAMSGGTANLTGNSLNNVIYAGEGNNVLIGGSGTDTLSYAYGVNGTTGVKVSLATTAAQATNGSGTDTLKGFENLTGSAYNDTLTGSSAANILRGGAGNDTLVGGSGKDTLYGDAGNDLLRGGTGNDVLYGGAGKDLFRFDSALSTSSVPNVDQIKDFVAADDTLQLSRAIFTELGTTTGVINAAYFKANTTGLATDGNDHIIYETDTGKVFYDADGKGGDASVQIAVLGTNLGLTNADFFMV
jgi:Ca2+-binding RTX toxin-like protein